MQYDNVKCDVQLRHGAADANGDQLSACRKVSSRRCPSVLRILGDGPLVSVRGCFSSHRAVVDGRCSSSVAVLRRFQQFLKPSVNMGGVHYIDDYEFESFIGLYSAPVPLIPISHCSNVSRQMAKMIW